MVEQVLSEIEDFTTAMARLTSRINLLLKTTDEMEQELRASLQQLINEQFSSTQSLLGIIETYLKAAVVGDDGISIKIEAEGEDESYPVDVDDMDWINGSSYQDGFVENKFITKTEEFMKTRSKTRPAVTGDLKHNTSSNNCIYPLPEEAKEEEDGDDDNYSESGHDSEQEQDYVPVKKKQRKSVIAKRKYRKSSPQRKPKESNPAKDNKDKGPAKGVFICHICGISYKMKFALDRHIPTHESDHIPKFKCDICSKSFAAKLSLKKHTIAVHEGQPKVLCAQCGAWFKHVDALRSHIRSVHEQVRPHQCHICPKSFKKKTHLKYHLKTHEGEGESRRQRSLTLERKSEKPVRCNFKNE